MALSTKVGNFTQPTSINASFAVTGVGFTPKALLLFATDETATGTAANRALYTGMATTTTSRAACSASQTSATNTATRASSDALCFLVYSPATVKLVAADFVSFDADGFTLNFSTVDAVARIVGYVALGGTDLTNVFMKEFIGAANTNTDQSFTGVGFKPDAMIVMSAGTASAVLAEASDNPMFGFATSSNQEVIGNAPNASTNSWQFAGILQKDASMAATLKTFDADGFTLTYSASSSQKYTFALCLKGGQYKAGVFNQATTTGNQAVTGLGFTPTGVILMSINRVASATQYTDSSRMSLGAASGSASRASVWTGGGNAGIQDYNTDTTKVLNMLTEGASPAVNTAADFVSMDSSGFTINNTTADATAREIAYLAFGNTAVAGTSQSTLMMMGFGM